MSAAFRLLPKHPMLLISVPRPMIMRLRREGYDLSLAQAPTGWGWLRFGLKLFTQSRRWHFLIASPLPTKQEKALRIFLRFFPFLVASWTRLDEEPSSILDSRLIKIAERDYNGMVQQGRQHATPPVHSRTPARTRSEFDHLLETPHP